MGPQAKGGEDHRHQGGYEAAGNGFKKEVGAQLAHENQAQADGDAAETAAYRVQPGAAKKEAKGGGAQKVGGQLLESGKVGHIRRGLLELGPGIVQVRLVPAQAAAEVVERFDLSDIRAVAGDPADAGQGLLAGGRESHNEAVRNGEDLAGVRAVGLQKIADGVLHPVNFSSAHQEMVAQVAGQGQKFIIVQAAASLDGMGIAPIH